VNTGRLTKVDVRNISPMLKHIPAFSLSGAALTRPTRVVSGRASGGFLSLVVDFVIASTSKFDRPFGCTSETQIPEALNSVVMLAPLLPLSRNAGIVVQRRSRNQRTLKKQTETKSQFAAL